MKPPMFVAELSGNHNHSLETALDLVRCAKAAGADAVKVQTYTPDCLTMDSTQPEFMISDPKSLWFGRTLYDLYTEAAMPWEFHAPIFEECKRLGLIGFSTPFSEKAFHFLEDLNVPMYKVASFEINHIPLLKLINKTKKPVLLSTGVAQTSDIIEALYQLQDCDVTLLKCTSEYPAKPEDSNLAVMKTYKKNFSCKYGLSDHSLPWNAAVAATILGASVIEKHMKLDHKDQGVDSKFSIAPADFQYMVGLCKEVLKTVGEEVEYRQPNPSGWKYRRSVYVVKDVAKGEVFTTENIRVIRPNLGCAPWCYDRLLGKIAQYDYKAGTPTNLRMIDYHDRKVEY